MTTPPTDTPASNHATDQLATLAIVDRVATITMQREKQRNALSLELLDAVHARLDDVEGHLAHTPDSVSVLVITGVGNTFSAGMDLAQVLVSASGDPTLGRTLLGSLGRLTLRLRGLPVVTVAKVAGPAIGGGCGLVCACDIGVGYADCKMGFPEVDLGLCPAVVAPWVVRKIGPGAARAVLLRGGLMTGTRAHALGILDELAPSRDALDELTERLVASLATGGPGALAATKHLLNTLDHGIDEALIERGADLSASVLATPSAQAALASRRPK